jgi:hypothetical protein
MFVDALGILTTYGRHLLWLGEFHELLVLNDLLYFPNSFYFTCLPRGEGASVVVLTPGFSPLKILRVKSQHGLFGWHSDVFPKDNLF